MSRIGLKPITVTEPIKVTLDKHEVIIVGPRGELRVALPYGVHVVSKNDQLIVSRVSENKLYKSLHGTVRNILQNAVTGVTEGFEKKCELIGIGYRVALENNELVLQVGFTHSVHLPVPDGLAAKIEKNIITISGNDKQVVGQFAAVIRAVRPPDRYKGKGIRYQGELIKLKQGKAIKAGA